jgi:hypothetical protein
MVQGHGDSTFFDSHFDSQDTLCFYAPHGHVLRAAPANLYQGLAQPYETNDPGRVHDYYLCKSQGWHKSENTFTGLANADTAINRLRDPVNVRLSISYQQIMAYIDGGQCPFDVATIRNRLISSSEVKLSELLAAIRHAGLLYTEVHCMFCRGSGAAHTPVGGVG